MKRRIAIVDYDAGNLHSVAGAVERAALAQGIACEVRVTAEPGALTEADGVILPGVGSFGSAMKRLRERGLAAALVAYARGGRPLLGICLGMQVLFTRGLEDGEWQGLGLIDGTVAPLPAGVKRPHMGWNQVTPTRDDPWLPYGRAPFYAYFAHSYAVSVDAPGVVASCRYGDHGFAAAVRQGSVFGVQFHPERSHRAGLALLSRFIAALAPKAAAEVKP